MYVSQKYERETYTILKNQTFVIMERKGHPRMAIKSALDYSDVCNDMLHDYAESLQKIKGMTRKPDKWDRNEFDCSDISFIWNDNAMNLIDRFEKRLIKLGGKYFDEDDLSVKCYSIIEI